MLLSNLRSPYSNFPNCPINAHYYFNESNSRAENSIQEFNQNYNHFLKGNALVANIENTYIILSVGRETATSGFKFSTAKVM